jgi:hypothetical protein
MTDFEKFLYTIIKELDKEIAKIENSPKHINKTKLDMERPYDATLYKYGKLRDAVKSIFWNGIEISISTHYQLEIREGFQIVSTSEFKIKKGLKITILVE